jgi:hypothetical protein
LEAMGPPLPTRQASVADWAQCGDVRVSDPWYASGGPSIRTLHFVS